MASFLSEMEVGELLGASGGQVDWEAFACCSYSLLFLSCQKEPFLASTRDHRPGRA